MSEDDLVSRFVDRADIIDAFYRISRSGAPFPVLVLYGLGGFGKPYVLRYIEFLSRTEPSSAPDVLATVFLDFERGWDPIDPAGAIWEARRQINLQHQLDTPRLDFLSAAYASRSHRGSDETGAQGLPGYVSELAGIMSIAAELPVVGGFVTGASLAVRAKRYLSDRVDRRLAIDWLASRLERPGLAPKSLAQALNAQSAGGLAEMMPAAFAADIAIAMSREAHSKRLLFCFDSYERLEEHVSDFGRSWKRSFIQDLAAECQGNDAPVLIVIATRALLRWAFTQRSNGDWLIDHAAYFGSDYSVALGGTHRSSRLLQLQIGDFTSESAHEYLCERRGFHPALAEQILAIVHGFPLGLSTVADLLDGSRDAGEDTLSGLSAALDGLTPFEDQWRNEVCHWLLHTLLEDIDRHPDGSALLNMLRASAVLRWFDFDLLASLLEPAFTFADQFAALTRYSFVLPVRPPQRGEHHTEYRLHPTMRALLRSDNEARARNLVRSLHRRAADHFQAQASSTGGSSAGTARGHHQALVEATYHYACHDAHSGMAFFANNYYEALSRFDEALCSDLLLAMRQAREWRGRDQSALLFAEGKILMASARYGDASIILHRAERLEPIELGYFPHRLAIAQAVAECDRLRGDYPSALAALNQLRSVAVREKDPIGQFAACWGLSLTHKVRDRIPEALRECKAAEKLLPAVKHLDPSTLVDLTGFGISSLQLKPAHMSRHKAELLRFKGDYVTSRQLYSDFFGEVAADTLGELYGLIYEGHLKRMQGRFEEAEAQAKYVDIRARELGESRAVFSGLRLRAQSVHMMGDHRDAEVAIWGASLCQGAYAYPYAPIYGQLLLGEARRLEGNLEDAVHHYRSAIRGCNELDGLIEAGHGSLGLAETARLLGADDAASHCERALSISRQVGAPWLGFWATLVLLVVSEDDNREAIKRNAGLIARRFRRSEGDRNLENTALAETVRALELGREVPPLRFNFL